MGETFTPDPFRGTGNFSIPIELSPGRDGFSPQLGLEYSTGNGNGPFGIGWRLTVPEISRATRKGLPRYTDDDTFLLAGADDLVPDTAVPPRTVGEFRVTRFRPRTEGTFARIEHWQRQHAGRGTHPSSSSFWKVTTGDNVTSLFGVTSKTVLAHPEFEDRVFRWHLELVYDCKGNYIEFEYKRDGKGAAPEDPARSGTWVNLYLKQISYGNLAPLPSHDAPALVDHLAGGRIGSDCMFQVILDYGEHGGEDHGEEVITGDIHLAGDDWDARPDPFGTQVPGFEVRTCRLCKRLLMMHCFPEADPLLVRSYDFAYGTFDHNGVTRLDRITRRGYRKSDTRTLKRSEEASLGERGVRSYVYELASVPPLEFEYSSFDPVTSESLGLHLVSCRSDGVNEPVGLDDPHSALIDLFSRGLPDILETRPDSYRYWRNLGEGHFSEMRRLDAAPQVTLAQDGVGLADVSGDGYPDVLELFGPRWGYYPGRSEGGWGGFQPFVSQPDFSLADPNLALVDLTGDGSLDALRTDVDELVVYECAGARGFTAPRRISRIRDLRRFPDISFTDPRVHIADMTGDGLADLVMVETEKVHYWPNLGFGQFGPRVTTRIPGLLHFEPEQMSFIDIDGTGPADLVQVESGRVSFWMNQSGNGWSGRYEIRGTPAVVSPESVKIADILGTGTNGILWSSPAGLHAYRFLPLAAGGKPALLTRVSNNMGRTTRFTYRPSTELEAAAENGPYPWVDRLPFPVYVLSRVDTVDHIAGSTLTTEYSYAHGRYDEIEREFVGFGRVDQRDTGAEPGTRGDGNDTELVQAPVETRTWYHTGVDDETGVVPQRLRREYYAGDSAAPPVPDTALPDDLTTGDERRQALRALRGRPLRQETRGLDGSAQSTHPFTVSEHVYCVRRIGQAGGRVPSAFSVREEQTVEFHYERQPSDPRLTHHLALEADEFEHVTLAAQVAYPRRPGEPVEPEQAETLITAIATRYAQRTDVDEGYRHGVPVQEQTFQMTGVVPRAGELLDADRLRTTIRETAEIDYEDEPARMIQKRAIHSTRYTYWDDGIETALPAGQIGLLALPHSTYQAAFTPGLVRDVYGDRLSTDPLLSDGGHVLEDGIWWMPSGHPRLGNEVFDPSQFYRPIRVHDCFGNATAIRYDRYALLVEEVIDPLGNVIRVENDYTVLLPWQVADPNGNRREVAFDALGTVVGTAVMGREGEALGDSLDRFVPHLGQDVMVQHIDQPLVDAGTILESATTRVLYDRWRYCRTRQKTRSGESGEPITIYTLGRDTHESDLGPDEQTRIWHSFLYQDGFGRSIQTKVQAESGPAPARGPQGELLRGESGGLLLEQAENRWVGTGRTVYNNKGNPVKQYEPYFSSTHVFESEEELVATGVTPLLHYDPLGRLIRTDNPDGTFSRVELRPWSQVTWDENDTVRQSEWCRRRLGDGGLERPPASPTPDQRAALQAAEHADTPSVMHLDPLGRTFLTVAHNRVERSGALVEERYPTRVELDIEGNQRGVRDALGRLVMRFAYNLVGNCVHQASQEAGERWMLNDAAGRRLSVWDSRGHTLRASYDSLGRPAEAFVQEDGGPRKLVERIVYGESEGAAQNHRGRVYQQFDQAGLVTSVAYDFKGNLLETHRQLAADYKDTPDWSTSPAFEAEVFTASTSYDALNRPVTVRPPDGSVIRPRYDEAGLLERLDVDLQGQAMNGHPTWTPFVAHVEHNARGQRTRVEYGNGAVTTCEYDPLTFRLAHLQTRRGDDRLQDLSYTYDPAGNVTRIHDDTQQNVYFKNAVVEAHAEYTYDAVYQLTEATGREHRGQQGQPTPSSWDDVFRVDLLHPHDGQAMRRYTERYEYDAVGNMLRLAHQADGGSWTREYRYLEPSLLDSSRTSNRLTRTTVGASQESYTHDAHGNMTSMSHLPLMRWDHRDQLQATARQVRKDGGTAETTYYAYDLAGQPVRKVTERQAAPGASSTRLKERIYLGNFEVYREYGAAGAAVTLERETLSVLGEQQRIAFVETRTRGSDRAPNQLVRYQIRNHLGSASLEIDDRARVISYEECTPYGSTSYQAVRNRTEAPKRYRWAGRERDEESGLYDQGSRCYAAWLGRWSSCEPVGLRGGVNLYAYASCSPTRLVDSTGEAPRPPRTPETGIPVRNLEKGLEFLNRAADVENSRPMTADEGAPAEWFLGEKGGRYRAFRLGDWSNSPGGRIPEGYTAVAHTHPSNTVISFEDYTTTAARGVEVGGVRTHLVGYGNNRWAIIEIRQAGAATATYIDLQSGKVEGVVELEAPGVNPNRMSPHKGETAQTLDIRSAIRDARGLARALRRSAPLGEAVKGRPAPPGEAPPELPVPGLRGPGVAELDPAPSIPLVTVLVLHDVAESMHATAEYEAWKETLTEGGFPIAQLRSAARLAYEAVEGAKATPGLIWRGARAATKNALEGMSRYAPHPGTAAWYYWTLRR